MDVKALKVEFAAALGTLLAIDPLTGLPYTDYDLPEHYAGETVRSNAQAPMSLAETDLPTWILFAGAATYPDPPDRTDGRLAHETRDFVAALYVCKSQAGIDGEAERKVEPYVNPARKLIQEHAVLNDGISTIVPGIMHCGLVRDDGIVQLKYGTDPVDYDGLRFVIRVLALNDNVYANQ